jgi:hypothetical protein
MGRRVSPRLVEEGVGGGAVGIGMTKPRVFAIND